MLLQIFKTLQDELRGSALSVFDDMNKRMQVVSHEPIYNPILTRIVSLKQKITQDTIHSLEEATLLWMTLKLLDSISLDIYNE